MYSKELEQKIVIMKTLIKSVNHQTSSGDTLSEMLDSLIRIAFIEGEQEMLETVKSNIAGTLH